MAIPLNPLTSKESQISRCFAAVPSPILNSISISSCSEAAFSAPAFPKDQKSAVAFVMNANFTFGAVDCDPDSFLDSPPHETRHMIDAMRANCLTILRNLSFMNSD